jgi:hypothetical protein
MGKAKAVVPAKQIAFKTKDGKEIAFKSTRGHGKPDARVKQLEKRLSAMEKAVSKYNNAVQVKKAVKEQQSDKPVKGGKDVAAIARVGEAGKAKV